MSAIGKQWERFSKWYDGLIWWKKILVFVPFLLVAIVLFTAFVFSSSEKPSKNGGDVVIDNNLDDDTKKYMSEKARLEKALLEKKKKEIELINQTTEIDKKAVDARNAIRDAKSIEEIDAVLRGMK